MPHTDLYWLPTPDAANELVPLESLEGPKRWQHLCALANLRSDLPKTLRLDRLAQRYFSFEAPAGLATKPVRLAVLGSNTVAHLLPGIRLGGLRRNLWITTYTNDHGLHLQELLENNSALYKFRPTTVLFALEARHVLNDISLATKRAEAEAFVDRAILRLKKLWLYAQDTGAGQIIQQAFLPVALPLAGNNEHRLAASPRRLVDRLNERIRDAADEAGVDVLAVDDVAAEAGLAAWHDPVLWHRAKQEVAPSAAPYYGDLVGRLVASAQGRSFKCLALDLDNTLWGGVIGDDGLGGIVLGQGSALGEAFVAFQSYVKQLASRGIILAVCSKNDEANALEAFERHPEMILRRADIACFMANWDDKATNIRRISERLNIGRDAIVFVDDNPFERNIVRRELPMVAVPEIPDDAALVGKCIADAGYFEAISVTGDDFQRSNQYQANLQREQLLAETTDLSSYLKGLEMTLYWQPFDTIGLQRIAQLINKTNQFNLTTQRYTEDDVRNVMAELQALTLQLRLVDRFGDNGIIGVVIGRLPAQDPSGLEIDTWLMSCRVLGRQVEEATLNLLVERASSMGANRIIGKYRPTAKNGMVREHYAKLGFVQIGTEEDGTTLWERDIRAFVPFETFTPCVSTK